MSDKLKISLCAFPHLESPHGFSCATTYEACPEDQEREVVENFMQGLYKQVETLKNMTITIRINDTPQKGK